ncbi:MAG: divalent-cation tolerance protein CutA [Acidobacteria bacterium]|nr:divalent-cation tolerance protein CutA [Acidobacteriota bacterium]
MKREAIVVLVTCGSREEALRIARALVGKRLAACVNVPAAAVRSIYRWKGKVEEAREHLLIIKSTRTRFAALRETVSRLHSYEVPEIIALTTSVGSERYLAWLGESVAVPGKSASNQRSFSRGKK